METKYLQHSEEASFDFTTDASENRARRSVIHLADKLIMWAGRRSWQRAGVGLLREEALPRQGFLLLFASKK